MSKTKFSSERLAVEFLESVFWPTGPRCPGCSGAVFWPLVGERYRTGLKKCKNCRKLYTVRDATAFKGLKLPMHKCLRGSVAFLSAEAKDIAHLPKTGEPYHRKKNLRAIARDLSVHWNTVKALQNALMKDYRRSQVSLLARALQPSVAVPLSVDVLIANGARLAPSEDAPSEGALTTPSVVQQPPGDMIPNGDAIGRDF